MAIKLRLTGSVSDAPKSLSYTPSGMPRFSFCVRVGGLRKRTYRITAYGSQARFGDHHLRTGDRVQIEGAYLRRYPAVEGLVRADTIRHVGRSIPPYPGTLVRFVPADPPRVGTITGARPPHDLAGDNHSQTSEEIVENAIAAALT